jgi:hypothetical protein
MVCNATDLLFYINEGKMDGTFRMHGGDDNRQSEKLKWGDNIKMYL